MILKIGDRKIDLYNQVAVTLTYDSAASAFSFSFYFNPDNRDSKAMFKPGAYPPVTVEHNGELLITGTLLSYNFKSSAEPSLITVSGYSKTGVLGDCGIPVSAYPLQSDKLSLKQIAEKLTKAFGLSLIIDPSVATRANQVYTASTADDKQSAYAYLSEVAGHKNIMVGHDEKGNLLLTEAKVSQLPAYDFTEGMPGVEFDLNFDGQGMHNEITLQKQATKRGKGNAGQASIANPYCRVFRPRADRQTSGENVDTAMVARSFLSDELKGLALKIKIQGWDLNGKLVRPNNIVTVTNPELYIYKKSNWFIESVDFSGDNNEETAILNCVLPEVFGTAPPKNIFD